MAFMRRINRAQKARVQISPLVQARHQMMLLRAVLVLSAFVVGLSTAILWQYPLNKHLDHHRDFLRSKKPRALLFRTSANVSQLVVKHNSSIPVGRPEVLDNATNVSNTTSPSKPRAMLYSQQCIIRDLLSTLPRSVNLRSEVGQSTVPGSNFRESRVSDQPGKIICLSAAIPAYSDFSRPSTELMERSGFDPYEVVEITVTEQLVDCPNPTVPDDVCEHHYEHRTFDGFCNNLQNPSWGNRTHAYYRVTPTSYSDAQDTPRSFSTTDGDTPLPNVRLISTSISQSIPSQHPFNNLLFSTFAQFIAHDLTLTPTYQINNKQPDCCIVNTQCTVPECFQFAIPPHDPFYSRFNITCHQFARSLPSLAERCRTGQREQFSTVSHWLDLSPLYGSSEHQNHGLRTLTRGQLSWRDVDTGEEDNPETPIYKQILPSMREDEISTCKALDRRRTCFRAGDDRVNQQPMLVTVHTLFLRYHNMMADIFASNFPTWSDEMVFQESRKLVTAVYQAIVYKEFLPVLFGNGDVGGGHSLELVEDGYFEGYEPSHDPHVTNEFSTAAFRLHTVLGDHVPRLLFVTGHTEQNPLTTQLNNQTLIYEEGNVDAILSGMLEQFGQAFDRQSTLEIQGLLFRGQLPFGLDLVAIDIQRGRDHGLGSYNDLRHACGRRRAESFDDLGDLVSDENINILQNLYQSVDDIDLYVGSLLERPLTPAASVGASFACVIALEFHSKRVADRFWFENPDQFTIPQLDQIRQVTLAELLCMTTALRNVPVTAVMTASEHNPLKPCKLFPDVDLSLFFPHTSDQSPPEVAVESIPKAAYSDPPQPVLHDMLNDLGSPMSRDFSRGER